MLERLSIENYALIQQLELELSPSLNIITGETGAGKSILLGALGLIMGNRADTAVLKDSGRNCVIEGLFDMGGYGLETFFDENELDYERHTVIRRIVTPAGKSRAYVNDLPVQLATLRELAAHLIDIHSQNQGVLVADGEFRIRVLDSLADNRGLRAEYGRAYRALREREQELARLREEVGRNRRDEEYMRFQWQQIAALGLHEGELQELEAVLQQGLELLRVGGRMCVISFHSLEDRMVKEAFVRVSRPAKVDKRLPLLDEEEPCFNMISRKPITAAEAELRENNRSHSAKLRIIEKVREQHG